MPAGKPAYIWSGTEWIPIGLQIGAKYQPGPPSASVSSTGDLWIDSDDNNLLYVWNGTGWVPITQTVSGPALVSASSSGNAFEIRQLGSGNAFVVEDSANPDATPFVIDASGNVGVGTGSPASLVHVEGGTITSQRYAQTGAIVLRRANGTASSPSAVLAGEFTGVVINRAYDGVSTYRDIGGMYFYANQNVSASQSGGGIIFSITPDGSTTLNERMRIDSSGNVGIGVGAAAGWKLHVKTTGSDNGVLLEQASDTQHANYRVYRTRNSGAAIQNGDNIGSIDYATFVGSGVYPTPVQILAAMDGTVSSTSAPSRLQFFTTPQSSVTQTERMRIDSNGNVGIGTAPGMNGRLVVSGGKITHLSPDLGASFAFDIDNTGLAALSSYKPTGSAFAISTTTTGGSVTERMRIDNAGLITGTGTSLGAWTAWTPVLTASTTNPTLGTGSVTTGAYMQIGKLVIARFRISFGSSGVAAGSGAYRISLPIVANTAHGSTAGGTILYNDNSTNVVRIGSRLFWITNASIGLSIDSTVTGGYEVTSSNPWTWAAFDEISGKIIYEAG